MSPAKTPFDIMRARCRPFPSLSAELPMEMHLGTAQFQQICAGFTPRSMDDRWFAYVDGMTLYLHRSWSGYCVFKAQFELTERGVRLRRAEVSRDPTQYRQTDIDSDVRSLRFLIQWLLAGARPGSR